MSFEQNQTAGKGFEAAVAAQGVVRDEASCIVQESSGESGSTLKAHDYIGLSEVTSMPLKVDSSNKSLPDLNLGETELRLGPPKSLSAGSVKDGKNQAAAAEAPSKWHEKMSIPSGIPEQQKGGVDQKNEQDLQSNVFWQAQISAAAARMIQQQQQQQQQDVPAAQSPASDPMNNGYSNVIKNSNKRVFSEAIGSHGFVDGRSAMPTSPAGSIAAANPSAPASNVKSAPLMPTSMYPWGSSSKQMPAAWRMGLEQSKGFGPFPSSRMHPQQRMNDSSAENNNNNNSPNSSGLTSSNKEDVNEDVAPSTSPPVVGWPPVQSFRKNTLASHPPPTPKPSSATEINKSAAAAATTVAANPPATPASAANTPSPLFVKVYMDGVPIGRKVDLKTNNSYDKLSSVLEDMFHRFITGQNGASEASSSRDAVMSTEKKLNFLQSSDFVLTYEDKDGDLMLVGDVPWGMFTGTVKRLRIMKGSEAIGLAAAGDKAAAATLTCQA